MGNKKGEGRFHYYEHEPIDLVQLNAHMPAILTDKDLDLFSKIENEQTGEKNN